MTSSSTQYAAMMAEIDALLAGKHYAAALAKLTPMLDVPPPRLEVMDRMSLCYWQMGDPARAVQTVSLIVKQWPDHARSWTKLGSMSVGLGDKESALGFYDQALTVRPGFLAALVERNQLRTYDRDGKEARLLRRVGNDRKAANRDRAKALHGVGLIEGKAGKAKSAMHFFGRSKALTPGIHDPAIIDELLDGQKNKYQARAPGKIPLEPRRPVFVVGMPRSGTTLMETILTRHSRIESVGESDALERLLVAERNMIAAEQGDTGPWNWVNRLSAKHCQELRDLYWLYSGAPTQGLIVDKMPLNALQAGFASAIFPDAKFLYMSRHPLDVGLSNYQIHYEEPVSFAKRLDWLGHMYRAVHDSAQDYAGKLGACYRIQSFRALVSNPADIIAQVLSHLDLGFEEACLAPQNALGVVSTASRAQVREGINKRGLNRWKPFEAELAPMIEALGGRDWLASWEAADAATPLSDSEQAA